MYENNTSKYFGPGIWYTIHSIALTIKEEEEYWFFVKYIEWIKIYFPCEKCRNDFENYLNVNPLPKLESKSIDPFTNIRDTALACFVWTFHLHNYVNEKLNKNIIDIENAYDTISKYIDGCGTEICKLDNIEQKFANYNFNF